MLHISTHILDTTLGQPAAGVAVRLGDATGKQWQGETDADGRWQFPELPVPTAPTDFQLEFATAAYFAPTTTLYPEVIIRFSVAPDTTHYHIPLLLAPYGYSTYRGS